MILEALRIRCPGCQKKYGVDPAHIKDSKPEFLCRQCGVKFWFEFPPPANENEILGKVKEPSTNESPTLVDPTNEKFPCPKCKFQNKKGSAICQSCGIVFEKFEKRQKGVQPDMLSSEEMRVHWEQVLTDYSNESKHEKFLKLCLAKNQLPYASQQYRIMIDTNTADNIAIKMRDKIIEMATLTYMPPKRNIPEKKGNGAIIIVAAGVILTLVGFMVDSLRILLTLGISLMALGGGFYVFKKYRSQA